MMLSSEVWRLVDIIEKSDEELAYVLLLYAGIDIMASMDGPREQEDVRRQDFIAWVDRYLLPGSSLDCTALELYGARCGLLHSYSSQSALSRSGQVREILHARGPRQAIDLATMAGDPSRYVVLFIQELRKAFRTGVEAFDRALATEPEKLRMVGERIERNWIRVFYPRG